MTWSTHLKYAAVALACAAIVALGVLCAKNEAQWALVPLLVLLSVVGGYGWAIRAEEQT